MVNIGIGAGVDGFLSVFPGIPCFLKELFFFFVFPLVEQKRNTVVRDVDPVFSAVFHFGKPFVGNHALVFQIGDQGIHIILKRGKTALF